MSLKWNRVRTQDYKSLKEKIKRYLNNGPALSINTGAGTFEGN